MDKVIKTFNEYEPENNQEKELEVRLRFFNHDRSLVSDKNLEFLGNPAEEFVIFDLIENFPKQSSSNRVREYLSGKNQGKKEYINKKLKEYAQWKEFDAKVTFSIEQKISSQTQVNFDVVRYKKVKQYQYQNALVEVTDVWEENVKNGKVDLIQPYQPDEKSYRREIELEFGRTSFAEFKSTMESLFKKILKSDITLETRDELVRRMNQILFQKDFTHLLFKPNQPVPLTIRDMERGVLNQAHAVTLKYDGERKLIFGIRLGNTVYVGSLQPFTVLLQIKDWPDFKSFLFDGEMVKHKDSEIYCIFDVIIFENSKLNMHFFEVVSGMKSGRIMELNSAFDLLTKMAKEKYYDENGKTVRTIKIPQLPFYLAKKPYNVPFPYQHNLFVDAVKRVLTSKISLPSGIVKLPDDGVIFTPFSQYSDNVYKWKPLDKLTIDFKIIKDGTLCVFENNMFVPFKGSKAYPIPVQKDLEHKNQIAEYLWDGKKFVYQRERKDKETPNYITTAQSNWDLIQNPVSLDTLLAKDLTLMRKYHNQVKKAMLSFVRNKGISTLLDVGSGRGGDVAKWKSLGLNVFAVEPNQSNYAELQQRVKDMNMDVKMYLAKGEDIPDLNIPPARCVCFFNSLTFFGSPDKMSEIMNVLQGQFDTNQSCYFVFIVMDKKSVEKKLKNGKFKLESDGTPLVEINQIGENEIEIKLPNTIVETQKEFLFPVDEFIYQMNEKLQFNLTPVFDEMLNQSSQSSIQSQIKLSPAEKSLSEMYRAVILKREIIPHMDEIEKENLFALSNNEYRNYLTLCGIPFIRIGINIDSSSFFMCLLEIFSKKFRQYDLPDKKLMVNDLRNELAYKLNHDKLEDYDYIPTEQDITEICQLMKINCILVNAKTLEKKKLLFDNKNPTIVLLNILDQYEILGIKANDTQAFVIFNPDIKELKLLIEC